MEKKDTRKNLKPFQPGQSGNPSGRPKLPPDVLKARTMNQIELERVLNRFINATPVELGQALTSAETPMMERMIANIVLLAVEKGDHTRLDFLLNRLIGKVKEQVDVTVTKPVQRIRRPDGTVVELTAEEEKA